MFNGIKAIVKEILSTDDERHSFIVGVAHSFYRHRKPPTKYMEEIISPEYHYYCCGRGIGHIAKFIGIVAIGLLVWRKRK